MESPIASNSIGKRKRMNRIFSSSGRCVLVPLDDSLISGPNGGLLDLRNKVAQIEQAQPSGIMAHYGTISLLYKSSIPTILNLTASTTLSTHTNKVLISTVERAISLGADAVAFHINFSSKFESDMLKALGIISERCNCLGIPLMVLAYPRKEQCIDDKWADDNYTFLKDSDIDSYAEIVAHCTRIAFEMGADIIKTQYTGSIESFEKVILAAQGVPVLIAGGSIMDDRLFFEMIKNSMSAGASGVCAGRNVFNRENSETTIAAIKNIVFNDHSIDDVMLSINNQKEADYVSKV